KQAVASGAAGDIERTALGKTGDPLGKERARVLAVGVGAGAIALVPFLPVGVAHFIRRFPTKPSPETSATIAHPAPYAEAGSRRRLRGSPRCGVRALHVELRPVPG